LRPNEAKRPPFPRAGVREALTLRGGARWRRGCRGDCQAPGGSLYKPSSDFACLAVSPDWGPSPRTRL